MTESNQFNVSAVPRMRGKAFHNHLVGLAASAFCQAGFEVHFEYGLKLCDGRADYVDLLAQREGVSVICEVETTARHALDNLAKAELLGMPLWIVVPNRKIKSEVARKLRAAGYKPRKGAFHISLSGDVSQGLMDCFPSFSSANTSGENGKTIQFRNGRPSIAKEVK